MHAHTCDYIDLCFQMQVHSTGNNEELEWACVDCNCVCMPTYVCTHSHLNIQMRNVIHGEPWKMLQSVQLPPFFSFPNIFHMFLAFFNDGFPILSSNDERGLFYKHTRCEKRMIFIRTHICMKFKTHEYIHPESASKSRRAINFSTNRSCRLNVTK